MRILFYNELDSSKIPGFEKLIHLLEKDDFRSADVKKIGDNLYRARLNKTDRLLFSLYKNKQQTYVLILEHIKNHAYEKSRFLRRGVKINEKLIPSIDKIDPASVDDLPHLEQSSSWFHLLHEPIAFDTAQRRIYSLPTPIIIIGTAGSGKTVLLLEKMKCFSGNVLYITQSAYLANHSENLYYANQYNSALQTVSFLSYQDFLDSIAVQPGRAMQLDDFMHWFSNQMNATSINDGHALFEEFRGVITGSAIESSFLSSAGYLALGVKETIFAKNQRLAVYELFERYLSHLKKQHLYDPNLVSFDYLSLPKQHYNYIVVDEVQDISPIQLHLIMSSLTHPGQFLLCGDANQIVYPNFFSWARIKTQLLKNSTQDTTSITRILSTNYRNSEVIIEIANKLLRIKNLRFGSIDRESHHEMQLSDSQPSTNKHRHSSDSLNNCDDTDNKGDITFLTCDQQTLADIDHKTHTSKNFAVIVLYDELKAVAAKYFQTPLIFSVQECKGLEYKNVILFNMVSSADQHFEEICASVTTDTLEAPIRYARNKDKTDKSLERYKFFVNALFVAITRAQTNLYWIEEQPEHPLLALLQDTLEHTQHSTAGISHHRSSEEEWQHEAIKLEQQGKSAQAQHIRQRVLQQQSPPWQVISGEKIAALFESALEMNDKKAKLALFEYALVYEDHLARNALIEIDFTPAFHPEDGMKQLLIKYFMMYQQEQVDAIRRQILKYGVDYRNPFNQTPLMIGAWLGNNSIIQLATTLQANTYLANNKGFNAFQIALEQACLHAIYATEKLPVVYTLLRPETLSLRINNQLIKLGHQQIEFFLINLMVALFYRLLPESMVMVNGGAFTAKNLVQAIQHWPRNILPASFHDPAYINDILVNYQWSDTSNTPAYFIHVHTDNYLLNPEIMLKVEGEWLYVYDILLLDDLAIGYQNTNAALDPNTLYKNLLAEKINQYKNLLGY